MNYVRIDRLMILASMLLIADKAFYASSGSGDVQKEIAELALIAQQQQATVGTLLKQLDDAKAQLALQQQQALQQPSTSDQLKDYAKQGAQALAGKAWENKDKIVSAVKGILGIGSGVVGGGGTVGVTGTATTAATTAATAAVVTEGTVASGEVAAGTTGGLLSGFLTLEGGLSSTGIGVIVAAGIAILAGLAYGLSFIKWHQFIFFGDNLLLNVALPGARVPTRYIVDVEYAAINPKHVRFTVNFDKKSASDIARPIPFLGWTAWSVPKTSDDTVQLDDDFPTRVFSITRRVVCVQSITVTDYNDRSNTVTIPINFGDNQCASHIAVVDLDPKTKKLTGHLIGGKELEQLKDHAQELLKKPLPNK